MEAVYYSQRVDFLIKELNEVYSAVRGLSRGIESILTGFQRIRIPGYTDEQYEQYREQFTRVATFSGQMEIIRVYLKCLGGKQPSDTLTEQERKIFGDANLMDGLVWYYMADHIESYVKWLRDIVKQCNKI